MSKNGKGKWNNIKIIYENPEEADYYVIINKPSINHFYIPSKTILFQMEPRCTNVNQTWGIKTWGEWENPDKTTFLQVRTSEKYINNCEWHINIPYNRLLTEQIHKIYNHLATICSDKYSDPGHIRRVEFLKYIDSKIDSTIDIDVYGNVNRLYSFRHNKQSLPTDQKHVGMFPYKYYFIAENNQEKNYITEKIWEPIISECLCFYWGAPNISDYIDSRVYIILDLTDFEESYRIIQEAIQNDAWSQRIDIIRQEKYKIMNYFNFFPTIERIITIDQWKINILHLSRSCKIYIFQKEKELYYRQIPFIKTLQEWGFTIEYIVYTDNSIIQLYTIYQKISTEMIFSSFLLLDEKYLLTKSYHHFLNHILYLPNHYDVCQIIKSEHYPLKRVEMYNSLYYTVRKYLFTSFFGYFISKKAIEKIVHYIKDSNDIFNYKPEQLIYECNEQIMDFSFYMSKEPIFESLS